MTQSQSQIAVIHEEMRLKGARLICADFMFVPKATPNAAYLVQQWEGPIVDEGLASIKVQRTKNGACLKFIEDMRSAGTDGFKATVYEGTPGKHDGARELLCEFIKAKEDRNWEVRDKVASVTVELAVKVVRHIPATTESST